MMAHWPRNRGKQFEAAQSAGIGFPYPDVMDSAPSLAIDVNASSPALLHADTPFDRQMVSISKAEHIKLKCEAHYWQTQFSRLSSHRERDVQHLKDAMAQRDKHCLGVISGLKDAIAQREAQCIALKSDTAYWRMQFARASRQRERYVRRFKSDLAQHDGAVSRLKDQLAQRDRDGAEALSKLKDEIVQRDTRAAQALSELQGALDKAQAHIKDLQKRLFGCKSEKPKGGNEQQTGDAAGTRRARGQQPGRPGHGRTMPANLPAVVEMIDLPQVDQCCPDCGLPLTPSPRTEDSEVIEIEVKAYRRVIRRKQYEPACLCCALPTIVTAPVAPKIIPKGKYGVSIWTELIVDKFLYGRPTHRLLQSWKALGLEVAAGTVAGGFAYLSPMFVPVMQAFRDQQRLDTHWHADETGWKVFEFVEGKKTNRWYLWVYRSPSAIYFDLEPSRAAAVPQAHFKGLSEGIVICDRYSAYKKMARALGFLLAFCWAHVRRDFLTLAQGYPELEAWSLSWVERIGTLYHLNGLRLAVQNDAVAFVQHTATVEQHLESMSASCDLALQDTTLHCAAGKVMASLRNHWHGLTVFVAHPEIPLDNNLAENAVRGPVVGRKNYYGSGSKWSAQFAASMFTVLLTLDQVWGINARLWMMEFLQACAVGRGAPPDLSLFLPWAMTPERLAHFGGKPPDTS